MLKPHAPSRAMRSSMGGWVLKRLSRLRPDKGLTINMKCKGTSMIRNVKGKKSGFENNNKFKEITIYPFFEHTSPLDLNGYSRTDDYLRG